MSDERGLRFETGLIVILVVFVACIGGILGFQGVYAKLKIQDTRLDRLEQAIFQGAEPTARRPEMENGGA